MPETSRTRLFFFLLTFAVTIACSIAICVLSAILLSWLNNLSLPGYHSAVDHAFGKLTATLAVGLTAAMALLISFVIMLAPMTMPKQLEARVTEPVGTIVALLWVGTIIGSIVFFGMTKWHPCAVMSRLQQSLSLRNAAPIPGAVSACREIMALDILAVINVCSLVAFVVSCPREEESTISVNLNTNTADSSQDDDEVDFRELAHHLDSIEDV